MGNSDDDSGLPCGVESTSPVHSHRDVTSADGPVAQLDRASAFGAEGWGFDSLRGRHSTSRFRSSQPYRKQQPISICALWLLAAGPISRCNCTCGAA